MSGFGVKGPLKKAVWCEDFRYSCADDITKTLLQNLLMTLNIIFILICVKLEQTETIKIFSQ